MKLIFNYKTISIIIPLIISVILAQPELTLNEAVSIALKQNYSIRIAKNNYRITKNNARPGMAGLYPQVSLSSRSASSDKDLSYLLFNSPETIKSPNSKSTSTSSSVSVNAVLFSGGKNYFTWEKQKKASEVGEIRKRQAIENTLVAVIQTYYQITSLQDNLEISREALEISKQRLERAKAKVDLGGALKLEMLNSEVDMNTDSVNVLNARLQLKNAKQTLNFILGRPIDTGFSVTGSVEYFPQKELAEWKTTALTHNAEVKESRLKFEQSQYEVKIAKSAYLPILTGNASYEKSNSTSNGGFYKENLSEGLSSSLNLSFDLFSGFRKRTNLQNARIGMKSQQVAVDQAIASLETNLANAYSTYQNARYTVEVEKQSLETARVNFERTQELYQLGQVTTTQFREAQLNWVRAELRLINEKYTAKFAEVELYRLSGTLPELFTVN